MNPIDRVVSFFSPQAGLKRVTNRAKIDSIKRMNGYDAAGKGRRFFRAKETSHASETAKSLPNLRANAHELERNNPYFASATRAVQNLTVGNGIIPVARCSDDPEKARLANELMQEWMQSVSCDFEGQLTLFGLQSLAMRSESLSGDCLLVRRMTNDKSMRVPLKIQLLEGNFLDHTKRGNNISQGVEFDNEGRRLGYWVFKKHPGDGQSTSRFISVDQVAHIYEVQRPGAVRGVPRGVQSYTRLKLLDDYQDARVEMQRMAATMSGAIVDLEGEGRGDDLPEIFEAGMMPRLNGGEDIRFSTPPSTSDHASFIKAEQLMIAAAFGITYEAMTNDFSGGNFANGKMSRIQMYQNVHAWREMMFIPKFCRNVERWFMDAALLAGHDIDGVTWVWTPPRKEILDLKNEIQPMLREVRGGFTTLSQKLRELGVPNPKEHLAEYKADLDLLDELGLVLDSDPRSTTLSGQAQVIKEDDKKQNEKEDDDDVESTEKPADE